MAPMHTQITSSEPSVNRYVNTMDSRYQWQTTCETLISPWFNSSSLHTRYPHSNFILPFSFHILQYLVIIITMCLRRPLGDTTIPRGPGSSVSLYFLEEQYPNIELLKYAHILSDALGYHNNNLLLWMIIDDNKSTNTGMRTLDIPMV
jgi:hypothetical protein